jgi:hypothetical protein
MTFLLALLGGIVGAAIGYFLAAAGASMLAPYFGISSFAGAAGYFAIFLIGPLGGVAGLIIGVVAALRRRGVRSAGAVTGRIGLVIVTIVALAAAGIGYMYLDRDIVNPNGLPPQLAFEIRLAAGATLPASPNDIIIHLDSKKNHVPANLAADKFRRDGDRPVIVGAVEIYYRESQRLLVLRLPNEPDRIFALKLGKDAKHAKEFGAWQRVDHIFEQGQTSARRANVNDNYEVRYRAVWSGEE